MPNRSAPPAGSRYTGLWRDMVNNNIEMYHNGTLVSSFSTSVPNQVTGAFSATGAITAGTSLTATAGAITATAGNVVITAGDLRNTAGNDRLGAVSAFGTTEPVSATVWKTGTAPAGAITTSGGAFTDGTTVKKIIAAGTVSDIQT